MPRRSTSLVFVFAASLAPLVLAGLSGCNGCGASSASLPPEPTASASAASSGVVRPSNSAVAIPSDLPPSPAGVGRRAGGPAAMFFKTARAVDLTPEHPKLGWLANAI